MCSVTGHGNGTCASSSTNQASQAMKRQESRAVGNGAPSLRQNLEMTVLFQGISEGLKDRYTRILPKYTFYGVTGFKMV